MPIRLRGCSTSAAPSVSLITPTSENGSVVLETTIGSDPVARIRVSTTIPAAMLVNGYAQLSSHLVSFRPRLVELCRKFGCTSSSSWSPIVSSCESADAFSSTGASSGRRIPAPGRRHRYSKPDRWPTRGHRSDDPVPERLDGDRRERHQHENPECIDEYSSNGAADPLRLPVSGFQRRSLCRNQLIQRPKSRLRCSLHLRHIGTACRTSLSPAVPCRVEVLPCSVIIVERPGHVPAQLRCTLPCLGSWNPDQQHVRVLVLLQRLLFRAIGVPGRKCPLPRLDELKGRVSDGGLQRVELLAQSQQGVPFRGQELNVDLVTDVFLKPFPAQEGNARCTLERRCFSFRVISRPISAIRVSMPAADLARSAPQLTNHPVGLLGCVLLDLFRPASSRPTSSASGSSPLSCAVSRENSSR